MGRKITPERMGCRETVSGVSGKKFRKVGNTPQCTIFESLVVTKRKQTFAGIIKKDITNLRNSTIHLV